VIFGRLADFLKKITGRVIFSFDRLFLFAAALLTIRKTKTQGVAYPQSSPGITTPCVFVRLRYGSLSKCPLTFQHSEQPTVRQRRLAPLRLLKNGKLAGTGTCLATG
jgi:hypothetical protein